MCERQKWEPWASEELLCTCLVGLLFISCLLWGKDTIFKKEDEKESKSFFSQKLVFVIYIASFCKYFLCQFL